MEIYLSNKIIEDLQYTDTEIATYMALKNLHASIRDTQVVTYNMLAYEIFGSKNYSRSAFENIKYAFNSLADRGMFTIVEELSKTEFVVDLSKLYFNFLEDGTYYTVIRDDEIHKIMNLDNRMDKFKLLRYFVTCLRTICKTQGTYSGDYGTQKRNYVGFMAQEYLCREIGVNYKTNFKLIEQYNDVLEENKLLYIYRHTELKRDNVTGQFKSFSNHYGRYEDKDDIALFAVNYEKSCGVNEEIVQSEKSNDRRRLAAEYNNLCFEFERYIQTYTDKELIEIYKYIHNKNVCNEKKIADCTSVTYIEKLQKELRDEDIFDNIPCVVAYINRKHNLVSSPATTGAVWGEPDPMEKDYSIDEILEMPTADEVSTNSEKPNNDLIDIGAIFEEEHITKKAVGSSYIPDFEDDEIWDLY